MIAAAAYLRKSNEEGDKATEAKSVEVQRDLVTQFATARGWTIDPQHVYVDDGVTGATYERPGLQALIAALAKKPFTKLVIVEQSRIGHRLSRGAGRRRSQGRHHRTDAAGARADRLAAARGGQRQIPSAVGDDLSPRHCRLRGWPGG